VNGVYRFLYRDHEVLVERMRTHYERADFAHGSALFVLAVAAYRGATPVPEGVGTCNRLLEGAGGPFWRSFILPMLAALEAMDERFDDARAHLEEARQARREFAAAGSLATSWAFVAAEVEMLAGDPERAEAILRVSCRWLRPAGEREWLATNTALLSEALYRRGRFADALKQSSDALALAPPGHLTSLAVARRVHAMALARAGNLEEAAAIATATIDLLRNTDVLMERGEAFAALAEVHALSDRAGDAEEGWESARLLFEQKGNAVSAARMGSVSSSFA
jgi:tetratricopeptide (TPR) repeat protein